MTEKEVIESDPVEIRKRAAGTVLEEGVDFTVVCTRPSLIDRIRNRTLTGPVRRNFVITPIKLGALLQISRLILDTKVEDATDRGAFEYAAQAIVENKDILVEIAAFAITNGRSRPSRQLVKYLDDNLTAGELRQIVNAVLAQMGIQDFFGCMVSIRGMNMLGTKRPANQTSGEPSEALSSTSDSAGMTSCGDEAGPTS